MPSQPTMTNEDAEALWGELNDAFSPGAPVQERDLFAGRIDQLRLLVDAIQQRGRHAIVFGERGVGKTSITNILSYVLEIRRRKILIVRVNAEPADTFSSIWKKVFKRLNYEVKQDDGLVVKRAISEDYANEITSDDVQLELSTFPETTVPIIIIDEFDRITNKALTAAMSDTIKALSDYSNNVTVIVVGVAEDVGQLINEHESISRALLPIEMPRMTQDELAQIIQSRYSKCGMQCDEDALWKMTFLSRGMPFYAQLLGMHSGRQAINEKTRKVTTSHADTALDKALSEVDRKIKEDYYAAVISQKEDTLYGPVLLACALAKGDELGRFQQSDVTEPLNRIVPGKNYKSTTFAFHMNAMCEKNRMRVLQKVGHPPNQRYRFSEPLMQPFVIMKGLAEKRIDDLTAEVYANRRQLQLSTAW